MAFILNKRRLAQRLQPEYTWPKWGGLETDTGDLRKIRPGFTPQQVNFITSRDQQTIELRRGSKRLGATNGGIGSISGLGVGTRFDGVQVPFFSYGRTVKYYDTTADDTIEVGSSLLPQVASTDEISIYPYQNLAGAFVYLSSPNSSIYKIPVANPGSAVDQATTTYRGFLKFGQSRSFLYNRNGATPGNVDQMGLYVSYVDKVDLSQYPAQVTGEAVGAAGSQSYSYTLANITGKRTAMYVQIVGNVAAGTETFTDDRNGNLTSNFSGTGTINYATGAITVTFSDVTTGSVTASYYYEDATSHGVCDFSIANVTARIPGEGNYFPQFDGGGKLRSVFPLATVFYCFHELKTWQVVIPPGDGSNTSDLVKNLPFREKMGVKSSFGAFGGAQAIYYLNTSDPNKPEFYMLKLYAGATQANIAAPKLLSQMVNFADNYKFDKAVVFEWGNYILLSCQQIRNGATDDFNSRTFIYNKKNGIWDLTDYAATRFAEYMGTLLAGDSLSNNVFTLFSGFDDDDNLIPNEYLTGEMDFGIDGLKRFTRMKLKGLIQTAQSCEVQLSFDGGKFVTVFTISGNGTYVDTSKSISIGSNTMGSQIVGGGATVTANPYEVEFRVQSPRFMYARMRIQCLGGGFFSMIPPVFKDVREKSWRTTPARNTTAST